MPTLKLETGETLQVPDGASPESLQGFVDQAKSLRGQKEPDTFMGESGLSGVGDLLSGIQNSGHTFNPSDAWGILKGIYNGQAKETGEEQSQAGEEFKKGNYSGALAHFIAGTPIIGHPLVHGAHNLASGNLGAAAGDLLSLFGPKAAELATEGAAGVGRSAGLGMYRRNLPFTSASSPGEIDSAVQAGVNQALPVDKPFPKPGESSLDRIGSTGKPGTILGDLESQTSPYVSGAAGQTPINPKTAFGPFIDKVRKSMTSNSSSVVAAGKGMLAEAQPGLEKLSPLVKQIFDKDPQTGQPLYTPNQQIHLFETWVNGNPQTVTREFAHLAKRDAYDSLNSNVFNDKNSGNAAPAGARDANTTLASGYKNAVNESAPEMSGINDQMHNILTLKDALNQAAKQSPKEFGILTNLAVGGLTASTVAARGGGIAESGGAGLAGVIALQALKSPRVATQLGIILGKKFPQILDAVRPFVLPAGAAGAGSLQSLRTLGNYPIEQLFQPSPQK